MDKEKYTVIGQRIRVIRRLFIGRQSDLADEAGLNVKTISLVENGHIKPPQPLLTVLSEKYKYNIDWILTGKGDELNNKKVKPSIEDLYIRVMELEIEVRELKELNNVNNDQGNAPK